MRLEYIGDRQRILTRWVAFRAHCEIDHEIFDHKQLSALLNSVSSLYELLVGAMPR